LAEQDIRPLAALFDVPGPLGTEPADAKGRDLRAVTVPGKTTTIECVVGLRSPDEGAIRVMGLDPRLIARNFTRSWEPSSRRARFRPT